MSRKLDVDVDALPDARHQRVHSILRRHGSGGVEVLNGLDEGARAALLGTERGTTDVVIGTARNSDVDANRFLTGTDTEWRPQATASSRSEPRAVWTLSRT